MRKTFIAAALAIAALGIGVTSMVHADDTPAAGAAAPKTAPVLDFSVKDIDGNDVKLGKYQGNVILLVNVASKCGNTPQYKPMEAMYEKLKDKGFVILGFPANNFGGQEPGSNEQIKEFCAETYKVAFPMFAKVSVKGDDMAPLYKYLTAQTTTPAPKGDITWNFEKFVIGRNGDLVARFAPKTQPDSPAVTAVIETELAKPKP